MDRPLHYLLADDGETPEPFDVGDSLERMTEWAMRWEATKKLAHDDLPCGGYVSTIFTGLATNIMGPPRLFETMAFDAEGTPAFQHRETTKRRALKTHAQVMDHVRAKAAGS